MKKNKLLVSVVMPVYNATKYLKFSIESILEQTYKNIELICVNDASTDDSLQILKKYQGSDKRIKIINLKKNLGCSGEAPSNYGIRSAKGKYVAIMDSDDVSNRRRIEKEVIFLESHEDYFLVGSQANLIDSNGIKIGERNLPLEYEDIYKNFFLRNGIMNPSVMFRNNFKCNFYTIKYKVFNDYLTYFGILNSGKKVKNLKNRLINYRIHQNNSTFTSLKNKFYINLQIKKRFLKEGYKPLFTHKIIVYLQFLFVTLFPEKLVISIYKKIQKY